MTARPDTEPTVSVIVPVHNGAGTLPGLLAALDAQTLPRQRWELLIADDASTDATADVVSAHGAARLIRMSENRGSYAARNAAIDVARGSVLAFTDADCRPRSDWLDKALGDLDALDADLLAGHIEMSLGESPSTAALVDFCRYLDQERTVADIGVAATANLIVRGRVIDRIGPFDARLRSAGDAEFSRRAREAGCRMVYAPGAVVHHDPRRRAREVVRKAYRVGKGREQLSAYGGAGWRRRPTWTHPGAWLPGALLRLRGTRGIIGIERLVYAGYRPSRGELRRMELAEWALVQLPSLAGSIVASIQVRRGR